MPLRHSILPLALALTAAFAGFAALVLLVGIGGTSPAYSTYGPFLLVPPQLESPRPADGAPPPCAPSRVDPLDAGIARASDLYVEVPVPHGYSPIQPIIVHACGSDPTELRWDVPTTPGGRTIEIVRHRAATPFAVQIPPREISSTFRRLAIAGRPAVSLERRAAGVTFAVLYVFDADILTELRAIDTGAQDLIALYRAFD